MSVMLMLAIATIPTAPLPVADIQVPPGFSATLFADHSLAPDIYTMTVDPQGRILVAGRGYVRVLLDDNGDGIADRAIDLIDGLKEGPMGLLAEEDRLYVVTNGGLQRYQGYNGKEKLKGPPETLIKFKTVGEHDAHMIRRGPDGWLYVLCGNMAGVTKLHINSSRSPVSDPVAGVLLRIQDDRTDSQKTETIRQIEIVADGFRNPYSFDFNIDGEPFAYDSDNERCVGLPWYEPCRFYHVIPGANYGWRSPQTGQFWRKPPYFVDCVPPVCYTGRGSPTGVVCYRHTHFPKDYQGGFFLADWTFGRIHYVPITPKGSTYEGKPEVFASAIGTSGFAPTGLAVHPTTGNLFISIGGRGTRGGVYRVSHNKNASGSVIPIKQRDLVDVKTRKFEIDSDPVKTLETSLQELKNPKSTNSEKLQALRIIQLALGDLTTREAIGTAFEGYTLRKSPTTDERSAIEEACGQLLSGSTEEIETEVFRTLAGIQSKNSEFARVAVTRVTEVSDVRKDIGYLTVLAQINADNESLPKIANALLRLDQKATKQNLPRDTFWPLRVAEIAAALGKRYPKLGTSVLEHPEFGQTEHVLLVKPLQIPAEKAAAVFVRTSKKDTNFRWTAGLVELLVALPGDVRRVELLNLWDKTELRDAILKVLPSKVEDEQKFVTGLASFDPQVISRSAKALAQWPSSSGSVELVAALKALRRLSPDDKAARSDVVALLQKRTGQSFELDINKWNDWLTRNHPETIPLLAVNDGFDPAAWKKREGSIAWDKGDAIRGKSVFIKASCAACHDGGRALGPSLLGISKRFGKDDLLTAILQPSKDVSPRYRPTRIATNDERIFTGVLIYEASDGVILQTNADTSVRIAGENIASKRPVDTSPMPSGLLDKLSTDEIADLFAYLKSLEELKR